MSVPRRMGPFPKGLAPIGLAWLLCLLPGCASSGKIVAPMPDGRSVAPTLAGDPAHPAATQGWVDTQLYFGLESTNHTAPTAEEIAGSEAEWRVFLDKEVTPRFPAGLSVVDVYGQWQGKPEYAPSRIRSKMLIIDYPDTEENREKIEAIRAAWKRQTGQKSVMRVTKPVDVSF